MNRLLILLIVTSVVLSIAAAKGSKKQNNRRRSKGNGGGQGNPTVETVVSESGQCGEWEFGECVPKRGNCGKGKKTGTRSGEGCKATTTTESCRVKCVDEPVTTTGGEETTTMTTATATKRGGKGKGAKTGKGKGNRERGTGGRRNENKPAKADKPNKQHKKDPNCKYARATLSECDATTGRQNKSHVLKPGQPSECAPILSSLIRCNRKETRKENRLCNYTMGQWGECNTTANRRYRLDTLTDPSQASDVCRPERTLEKPCPPENCEYSWVKSECDAETNEVTLTGTLVNAEEAPPRCEPSKTVTMPCTKKNGKDKCKYGDWGSFGACINGLKSRTRDVRKGGRACKFLAKEIVDCE